MIAAVSSGFHKTGQWSVLRRTTSTCPFLPSADLDANFSWRDGGMVLSSVQMTYVEGMCFQAAYDTLDRKTLTSRNQ